MKKLAVLNVHGLSKSFGDKVLFDKADFEIGDRDRIGLIGANGAGKTTLFRIITGSQTADGGSVILSKNSGIAYMEQLVRTDAPTAYDEVLTVFDPLIKMEKELERLTVQLDNSTDSDLIARYNAMHEKFVAQGGLTYKSRARSALMGLGIDDSVMKLPPGDLSGGQLSKVSLARLLLSGAGLLLLDEPTNHLDIKSVEWLEEFILSMKSAALIISHDRYFLDRVTNRTFEIEHRKITCYDCAYTRHLQIKQEREESLRRNYDNTMREVKRIEGIIEQQHRWNRERNIRTADSKQKQIDRMLDGLERPESEQRDISFNFEVKNQSGNDVLAAENVSKSFGDKELYSGVNIKIFKGQKIFLLGENGCGKTTLLKQLLASDGKIKFGTGVKTGYFDQTQSTLTDSNTVLDEVWNSYPTMTQTQVRGALAVFLFKGDDVFKNIGELSGGERARVALLKLMLSDANFLLLDEPTNHLDLYSRDALEKALCGYDGTVLAVSHDRHFINRLADGVLYMNKSGVDFYQGNYDSYLAHRPEEKEEKKQEKTIGSGGMEYKKKKERAAALRKAKSDVASAEKEIADLEQQQRLINEQLWNGDGGDYQETLDMSKRAAEISEQLDGAMLRWAELSDIVEILEKQL